MSIRKISLLSLIFITSSSVIIANLPTPKNPVEQSIEQELHILDATILQIAQELQLAENQKIKDEIEFNSCMAKFKEENDKSWWGSSTDCSAQIAAYKGAIKYRSPDGKLYYFNTGSEGVYLKMKQDLKDNEKAFTYFKVNFKRGKINNDIYYLKVVEQAIKGRNALNKQVQK